LMAASIALIFVNRHLLLQIRSKVWVLRAGN
jgi:hypothetical protein